MIAGIASWLYHPATMWYLLSAVVAGPLSLYILWNQVLRVAFIGKPRKQYGWYFWIGILFGMPAICRALQGPPTPNLFIEMSTLFQWLAVWCASVLVSGVVLRLCGLALPKL